MHLNPTQKRLLGTLAAILLIIFGIIWFSGAKTSLKLPKPVAAIGPSTSVLVEVDAPHGVKAFSAVVEQNGQSQTVYQDKTHTRQRVGAYTFSAGQKQAPFLKEGPARLIMKAKSNDLRGATTELAQDVQVVLRPPTIAADGFQHYINQGGSELVTLDLGGNWTEAGVRVANYSAGSFAHAGPAGFEQSPFLAIPISLGRLARNRAARVRAQRRRHRSDDLLLG